MVREMQQGSVIVDVAIDQGGSVETIDRITTHDNPTYEKHGVIHYAVANIPGSVARTSTIALTNVTTGYGLQIANRGYRQAAAEFPAIAKGINVTGGKVTYQAVAEAQGVAYTDIRRALSG
jgi:alanine dehydrogenase